MRDVQTSGSLWRTAFYYRNLPRLERALRLSLVRNHCARYLRRAARTLDVEVDALASRSHDTPERDVARERMVQAVIDGTAALPPTQRDVFVLREIRGCSTAEAAAHLGIEEGAAKVRLHRARSQLRRRLLLHGLP